MNIAYSLAISPLYLSTYEKFRLERNCYPYLFFTKEELFKDPTVLKKYLDEKEQFCSDNGNYVFLKAVSLMVNDGKINEGIELMNNYLTKYPNIENSEEARRMVEKWSEIKEQAK